MISPEQQRYMQMAIDLSEQSLDVGKGGPFGAVIVREGCIVGASGNEVMVHTDPTAHAEIMAIRNACANLKTLDLSGCIIYSSGEPCPMCMAAIYWSKMKSVFYANTELDSLKHGFVDKKILEELKKPKSKRKIKSIRIKNNTALKVFEKALTKTS
jgi:guanine deaminase